jgi:hypothetical protein
MQLERHKLEHCNEEEPGHEEVEANTDQVEANVLAWTKDAPVPLRHFLLGEPIARSTGQGYVVH